MFDRFSDGARKAMCLARQESLRLNHEYIGSEHILLGILHDQTSVACQALNDCDLSVERIRRALELELVSNPAATPEGQLPFTPRAKRVLELSVAASTEFGHDYIGCEHLLLGLRKDRGGVAAKVLIDLGLEYQALHDAVEAILTGDDPDSYSETVDGTKSKTPALDAFGVDLTKRIALEHGKAGPWPREELDQALRTAIFQPHEQVVLLVGPPGVGKTALIRSLAFDIANGTISPPLSSLRVVNFDLFMAVSGTKFRGQLEERIKAILTELKRSKNVVFVVDNFEHMLLWKSTTVAEDDFKASIFEMFRVSLDQGELRLVATLSEAAYENVLGELDWVKHRVQPIWVREPDSEVTKQILKSQCSFSEKNYKLEVPDSVLDYVLEMSAEVLPELNEPARSLGILRDCMRTSYAARSQEKSSADWSGLDAQIEQLEKQKERAVADQDFMAAANLQNKIDISERLRTEKKQAAEAVNVDEVVSLTTADIKATIERRIGRELN